MTCLDVGAANRRDAPDYLGEEAGESALPDGDVRTARGQAPEAMPRVPNGQRPERKGQRCTGQPMPRRQPAKLHISSRETKKVAWRRESKCATVLEAQQSRREFSQGNSYFYSQRRACASPVRRIDSLLHIDRTHYPLTPATTLLEQNPGTHFLCQFPSPFGP